MKILHVFFYMKTGGVERNITRMLPRLHNPPDFEMKLILAVAGGELLNEIDHYIPTKVLHGKDMFRQIYDEALGCDVVHVHTINDMRLLLDAVVWSPGSRSYQRIAAYYGSDQGYSKCDICHITTLA
jgi:hypothetical protein